MIVLHFSTSLATVLLVFFLYFMLMSNICSPLKYCGFKNIKENSPTPTAEKQRNKNLRILSYLNNQ